MINHDRCSFCGAAKPSDQLTRVGDRLLCAKCRHQVENAIKNSTG